MHPLSKTLFIFYWTVFCGFAAPISSTASDLRQIRTGKTAAYTRIVFEFDAPTEYALDRSAPPDTLRLRFPNTTTEKSTAFQNRMPAHVTAINVTHSDQHLEAMVQLPSVAEDIKVFTLSAPDRIVVDAVLKKTTPTKLILNELVFQQTAASESDAAPTPAAAANASGAAAVATQTTPAAAEKPPAAAVDISPAGNQPPLTVPEIKAVKDSAAAAPQSHAAPILESPVIQPSLSVDTPDTPRESLPRASQAESRRMPAGYATYLIAVLIALSLVIAILVFFLLFQKRKPTGQAGAVELKHRFEETEAQLASLDAEIRAKLEEADHA